MGTIELLDKAEKDLERVLNFFSRVDGKASVVFAVDTAMLGLLVTNAPNITLFEWPMLFVLVPLTLIGISLWHIYKTAFPSLEGGYSSLIYFREIAKRTESKYIDDFMAQDEASRLKDILIQIWKNSEILNIKFSHLKYAFYCLLFAVFPWVISLLILSNITINTGVEFLVR